MPKQFRWELKDQVSTILFLALCWTPEVTGTRTAETWSSLWVCKYTFWVQWEDSSTGVDQILLPCVSQLHICKIVRILFFDINFIHIVCLGCGPAAVIMSYCLYPWHNRTPSLMGTSRHYCVTDNNRDNNALLPQFWNAPLIATGTEAHIITLLAR